MRARGSFAARVLAAAFSVGMALCAFDASAAVVSQFSINPSTISEGGFALLDLRLNLYADDGYHDAQITGVTATVYSGDGRSVSFESPGGGTSRVFSLLFTYPNPGDYVLSFLMQVIYKQFLDDYVYGYIIALSGDLPLRVDALAPSAVPIPAALPVFASGLGAMGLIAWRSKRRAAPRL